MKTLNALLVVTALVVSASSASAASRNIAELKSQILQLAKSYEGQGDPDRSLQKTLDVLVAELVARSPMPPVRERISLVSGVWKQVWGPYDYRDDKGGVDPTLGFSEIYQVVFPEGYYYNVAPYYPNGDQTKEQIGYLRGEFALDPTDDKGLVVRFTRYPGVEKRPAGIQIWELPALSEAGQVENEIAIVPTWVVEQFFKGGRLEEVYTDHDLRIVYGTSARPQAHRFLYVMSRVSEPRANFIKSW